MRLHRNPSFKPFATRGRPTMLAILLTFALCSAVSVALSIWATSRSQHKAAVVEVAARQRTLAERYVKEVLLALQGVPAAPQYVGELLDESARVLLEGGTAPAVYGDDDETGLSPASGREVRSQLRQERLLVHDLVATGSAVLEGGPVGSVTLKAHEHISSADGIERLRVLAALTSNVSLNAARTIASRTDRNINDLISLQIALGAAGLLASLLLAWALIATTRRQTAHFRSLVTSSTDLVLVFGAGGCRYASDSVIGMVGRSEKELLGEGFAEFVHPDERASLQATYTGGEPPSEMVFRMSNRFGEWRHLEAYVTDLRPERRIRGVVLNARDITERVQLEDELTHQAFHDGLTGLANRALFRDRLDHALVRSARSREEVAVLLVDLDGFKQVNDSLGHDAGDNLLQQVGVRFREVTRSADTLARLGGDEFAVLLEGADESVAAAAAGRLLERLSDPIEIAGHKLSLGASIGVVVDSGADTRSEDMIRHADVAMYAAKEAGRGRYEVFRYDMARELGELLGLEHELRESLKRREFKLDYQPLFELPSREIVGAEALVRWHSPTRGIVQPDRFIAVAESTGLILALGEFVLGDACSQTSAWLREGLLPDGFRTWVNLSGKQLSAGGLSVAVRHALEKAQLPPERLGLEVTETAIVVGGKAGERARTELQELHDLGVKIAIDDFGTGFSSLGQLRRFPIDAIKVDRSFIQGVEHSAKDAAITANLASLAHALDLVAVAEGIESDGQLRSVLELGCDVAQGFLFARPVPAGEVTALLMARHGPERGRLAADESAA